MMKSSVYLMVIYLCSLSAIFVECYNVPIPDKTIIIGDSNVIDFVRNFYNEIILRYEVPNFKMVVWNPSSYSIYENYGIPVEHSPIELSDKVASTFVFSQGFTKKINDRLRIILEYLKQNRTLLCMDADLYFNENPLNLLNYINPENDITYAMNVVKEHFIDVNVGLMYIKPTNESIKLFERILKILKISQSDFEFIEQGITNLILSSKRIKNLKYGLIEMNLFLNGHISFIYYKNFVDEECKLHFIGFHNNCIHGGIGKIYRFRELGLWKLDDDEYYSSKSRKYIKYSSIIDISDRAIERMIYLMYLGRELNRTIIFPRFLNEKFKNVARIVSFIYIWNIAYFDKTYGNNYRENISFSFSFSL